MSVLITHLTRNWEENLSLAVVTAIVVEAVTMMMRIVLAHVSDKYCMDHHYKLIICTNIAFALGLFLLWIPQNWDFAAWVVYIACLLMSLGKAGREAALYTFLQEQYLSEPNHTESTDENILETRLAALWNVPWFFGSLFPFISQWLPYFIFNPAVSVVVSSLIFLWARSNYFIYNGGLLGTNVTQEDQISTTSCPVDEERDQTGDQICRDNTEETSRTTPCFVDRPQRRETCIATGGNVSMQPLQTMELGTIPCPVDEETHQRGRQICAQNMPDTHSVMDEAESREIGTEETRITVENAPTQMWSCLQTLVRFCFQSFMHFWFLTKENHDPVEESHQVEDCRIPCPVEEIEIEEIDTEENLCPMEESLSRAEILIDTVVIPCITIEQARSTEPNEATQVSYLAEQPESEEVWTLKKLEEELHFFKKMLPMWFAFVIYIIVDAAGSSLFFEQISNMDNVTDTSEVYFANLTSFTAFVVSFLYEKVIAPKKWKHATLVKIGSAMTCSQLCCFAAWLVEVYKLSSIKGEGLENDNTTTSSISMSSFWLVPQFFLLGIMKGLAEEGLVDFFNDRINYNDKLMERYGEHITSFVHGVIRLLTTLNILVPFLVSKKSWFGDNINTSRLDLYFMVLTLCSFVNIGYYLCVAHFYATSRSPNAFGEEQQEQSA